MTWRRHFVWMAGLLGLGAITFGILAHNGRLHAPFVDHAFTGPRAAVHAELERLESVTPAGPARGDRLWPAHLEVVDKELARGHIDGAVRAWHDAYGAALESRTWQSMIAVGDAFIAIGRASGSVRGARLNAREAYMTALTRARRERSLDGVLRTAEAFRALEERVVVDHCLHIAAQLAAGDEQAQEKVRDLRHRWAARQRDSDTELEF